MNLFNDSEIVNINREKVLEYIAKIPGITPAQCANAILKGVEKNKGIIVVTAFAKFLYLLQRISPGLAFKLLLHDIKNLRDARLSK